jgi:hypothetical protein
MDLNCYLITHSGDGERGQKVLVKSKVQLNPEWYAKQAAEYLDDQEQREENMRDSDFDNCSQVIEVSDHPQVGTVRYRCYCSVKRSYEAETI